jgi:hypothetical protein
VYQGKLYAGTCCNSAIYVYDGTTWTLNFNTDNSDGHVHSLVVFNDKLYAGTNYYEAGENRGRVWVYDGTSWSISDFLSDNTVHHYFSLTVFDDKLYAGTGDLGKIRVFDGTSWSEAFNTGQNSVVSLASYDGKLYAGTTNAGIIYVYDGSSWGTSYLSGYTSVNSLAVYNGKLYAGTGNDGIIYVYDGTSWSQNYDSAEQQITSLAVYQDKLYAGGLVNGTVYVYDGTSWTVSYASGEYAILSLAPYNDRLYAGSATNGRIFQFSPPDTTAPLITPNVTCDVPGNSPWCKGNIAVSWTVTDPESLITSTAGCDPTTINSDTPLAGTTLTCTATSGGGTTSNSVTVYRDGTAPTVSLNSLADSCDVPGNAGWCRGTQTAGFSASDATSGVTSPCAGALCNFTQSTATNGSAVNIASGVVCDVAGNCDPGLNTGPYLIDSVAPGITPGTPPAGSPYLLNQSVNPSFTCTDDASGSGFASTSGGFSTSGPNGTDCTGPSSVNTGAVGSQNYGPLVATDVAGNSTSLAGVAYNVLYNFSGFFSPVDNPGPGPTFVFNKVKAGSAIPVKFRLSGNQGLNIFATGYPQSEKVDCNSAGSLDDIEETVTAGGSSLSYDASLDQYNYVWKTDKSWAGTCRKLIVRLIDSTDHVAYFNFK